MSRRLLLVNFLVMVALSVVAAGLVAFPPAGPAVPEPLLPGFEASAVTELALGRDAQGQTLVRDGSGGWILEVESSGSRVGAWPASEGRARAGLKMLAEATITRGGVDVSDSMTILDIASGETHRFLTFGEARAAGRAAVRVDVGAEAVSGLTDDRLHAVFAQSGLLPWRDDRAMPGVARDPSKLVISAPVAAGSGERSRIEVSRLQGRWGLVAPVVERAETAAVQASIDALGRMTVAAFRDDLDPAQSGLTDPRVTMEVSGGRGPDAYMWRIEIGAPATADANQMFARLSGHIGEADSGRAMGPVYVVLPIDGPRIFTNPEAYLARTSLQTPTADIRRFTIRQGERAWRYERTLDGWTVLSPGAAAARAATQAEAGAIPIMLDTLTTAPADSSTLAMPTGFAESVTLEIEGTQGLVSESVVIGRSQATGQGGAPGVSILTVRSGAAWRRYVQAPEAFAVLLPVGP